MGKLILNLTFISYLLPRLPTISDRRLGLQIQYISELMKCEKIFESISADLHNFLFQRVSCGRRCIYIYIDLSWSIRTTCAMAHM